MILLVFVSVILAIEKPKKSVWNGIALTVKVYLKENLKDPKSLDIGECSDLINVPDKNQYLQRVKYRAKNSFGGNVINNHLFLLVPDVNDEVMVYKWKVKSVMDYDDAEQFLK